MILPAQKLLMDLTYHFTNGRTFDHLDGWQYVNGKSCYFKNGVRLTNCVADGYKLDGNGHSETRDMVRSLVAACTNSAMSNDRKFSQSGTGWFITTGHTNVPMNICPRDGTGMLAGRMILQSSVSMIKRGIVINIHRCSGIW